MCKWIILAVAMMMCASVAAHAATVYVSTQGKAEWSGKLAAPNAAATDGPLPTLAAARDKMRGVAGAKHIVIRGGTYYLTDAFKLGAEDSGTAAAPVVYEAYLGEHPVISGGKVLTGWTQSTDKKVWTAPYATPTTQMFVNGSRAQRARTPNFGYLRIDGPSSAEEKFLLHYGGDDIKPEWANSGAEVVVLLAWAEMRRPIIAVDPVNHVATLAGAARSSTKEDHARYWVENAPGSADADGEWLQDLTKGTISYTQKREEDVMHDEFIVPVIPHLVEMEAVHDVTFKGLAFRHAAWTMPAEGFPDSQAARAADSAVQITGGVRVKMLQCDFSALGGYAIHLHKGSSDNVVDASTFVDLGAGAVRIGEEKVPATPEEECRNNQFTNNEVHDLGSVYAAAVAIWVGQSPGNTLSHNHLHHMGYSAISVGWTWGYGKSTADHNRIEYNHIHDIGLMLSDLGGVYVIGMQPGSVIRNNLIHNVSTFTYGGWGIYTDEGATGILIENNIVYETQSSGFHQHYGKDNIIRNNIFALGENYQVMRTKPEPTLSFTFEHNIVIYDRGSLLGYNWNPIAAKLDHNIYWDMRGKVPTFSKQTWEEWQAAGNDVHSKVVDPGFVSPQSYNFRLKPGSAALAMGFHPIDMSHVGPQVAGRTN